MIIDFHTHIFPDRIAAATIKKLEEKGGIPAFTDGTVAGLEAAMERAGVDLSVTLPVVTAPRQFESVLRYAGEINAAFEGKERRLLSFVGIHPQCEDIDAKMAEIKERGFLGVKIHPDYQDTYIDDAGYVEILTAARKYDLIVVAHAGVDVAYTDQPIKCTSDRVLRLLDKAPHSKLVLAHCGGAQMFDEVLAKLCGADVYFDTGYVLRFIGKEMFAKIVEKHGTDRILFGSDAPWSDMKTDVEILRSFGLDKVTEEKIFSENARALLGL
jgi:predicted TIM-barrel fold metal-dependent hydrolase